MRDHFFPVDPIGIALGYTTLRDPAFLEDSRQLGHQFFDAAINSEFNVSMVVRDKKNEIVGMLLGNVIRAPSGPYSKDITK